MNGATGVKLAIDTFSTSSRRAYPPPDQTQRLAACRGHMGRVGQRVNIHIYINGVLADGTADHGSGRGRSRMRTTPFASQPQRGCGSAV